MKNTALLLNMIDRYNALAYTHDYIFGFQYKGNIYMAQADADMLPSILKLDRASRGQGMALRFCPNTDTKLALLPKAEVLCSTVYFDDMVDTTRYNKGEIFEKLVTERFGQEWTKDHVPFTEAGDVDYKGKSFQVKYEKATFTNEKTLGKMEG